MQKTSGTQLVSSDPADIASFHRYCASLHIEKNELGKAREALSYNGEDLPGSDLKEHALLWNQEWQSVLTRRFGS